VLLPFFDVEALSQTLVQAARDPDRFAGMGQAARERAIRDFDQARGTAAWLGLIDEVLNA